MQHKVRMLKTQRGVRQGSIHPATFIEGEEHEIDAALLESFIELGAVELVEEKSRGHAPANKMRAAAPENKSK